MSKAGYKVPALAAVALVATVAKTVVGANAPAGFGLDWTSYEIAFDGVSATNPPVLVELCTCTFATNPPGTASTTSGPTQEDGRAIAAGATGAYAWTTEPTVVTPFDNFTLTPNGGTIIRDIQQGRTPDSAVSTGFCIRCTASVGVNFRGSMSFERC